MSPANVFKQMLMFNVFWAIVAVIGFMRWDTFVGVGAFVISAGLTGILMFISYKRRRGTNSV